jgi:hypothetical protein
MPSLPGWLTICLLLTCLAGAASAQEPGPSSQTLIVDRNLELSLVQIPAACRVMRISLLRRDEVSPGYLALTRLVRQDLKWGPMISLSLSPEFFPHTYSESDVRLTCYSLQGKAVMQLVNSRALSFSQAGVSLSVTADFRQQEQTDDAAP